MLNNVAPRIMAVIQAIIVMTRIVASPVKGISAIGMLPRTCDNLISLVVNRSTHLKSISCIRGDKSQIMGVYLKNNTMNPSAFTMTDKTPESVVWSTNTQTPKSHARRLWGFAFTPPTHSPPRRTDVLAAFLIHRLSF